MGSKQLDLFLRPNERKAVSGFVNALRHKYGARIKEIILFGSKINRNSNKDSDIDVLVVLSGLSWKIKKVISGFAAEENIKHDVVISTVRYDIDMWEIPAVKKSLFGRTVRNEGIRL